MREIIRLLRHRPNAFSLPIIGIVLVLVIVGAIVSYFPRQTAHASSTDWTTFLGSNTRTGYDAVETTINTTQI